MGRCSNLAKQTLYNSIQYTVKDKDSKVVQSPQQFSVYWHFKLSH